MLQRKGANTLILNSMRRSFAAINESSVNLSSVSPSDVHESTPRAVGALMAAMGKAPGSQNEEALAQEIDEYFRKKFRKVSFEDAKAIMSGLGFNAGQSCDIDKIPSLDDKFWVWETLEEATRPHVDEISKDEIHRFFTAWALQMKGSEELNDLMQEQIYRHFAEGPIA